MENNMENPSNHISCTLPRWDSITNSQPQVDRPTRPPAASEREKHCPSANISDANASTPPASNMEGDRKTASASVANLAQNPPAQVQIGHQRESRPVWRQWLPEILCCFAGLSSFIVIVAILRSYHNHCLPKMPSGVTLNTVLAFFATFSKAAFMAVVSEALSQWKWNLTCVTPARVKTTTGAIFNRISDFSNVDSASRGMWGSWLLIWNLKFRHLITGAAALSLLSSLTSPITQQIIAYSKRPKHLHDEASTRFARDYVMDPDFYDNITEAVTRGMMGGFFSPVEHSPVHCGSNNCTFEPFTTLAACMKIKDISHTLEVSVIENSVSEDWSGVDVTKNGNFFGEPTTAWRARIPQIDMELVTPVSIAFSMEGRNRSIAFQDANDNLTAIANLYLIWCNAGNVSYPSYTGPPVPWKFNAVEIFYHLCVNTYEVSFSKGVTTTTLVSSSNAAFDIPTNQPLHCDLPNEERGYGRHCVPNLNDRAGKLYLQDPNNTHASKTYSYYSIERSMGLKIIEAIFNMMPCLSMWNGILAGPWVQKQFNTRHLYRALFGGSLHFEQDELVPERQMEGLAEYFQGMAVSLTNLFRNGVSTSQRHNGTCWGEETYVQVRWGWLAFLAVEMLLSYLFLTATIHKTAKLGAPVLKSSELATLLASTAELREVMGTVDELGEARERSKSLRVQLRDGRLMLG